MAFLFHKPRTRYINISVQVRQWTFITRYEYIVNKFMIIPRTESSNDVEINDLKLNIFAVSDGKHAMKRQWVMV